MDCAQDQEDHPEEDDQEDEEQEGKGTRIFRACSSSPTDRESTSKPHISLLVSCFLSSVCMTKANAEELVTTEWSVERVSREW